MSKRTLQISKKKQVKIDAPRKKKKKLSFAQKIENIEVEIANAKVIENYGKLGTSFLGKCFYLYELLGVNDLVVLIMRIVLESGQIVLKFTENAYTQNKWYSLDSNRNYSFITISQQIITENERIGSEWKEVKKRNDELNQRMKKDPYSYSFMYKRPESGPTCFIVMPMKSVLFNFPGFPIEEEFKTIRNTSLVYGLVNSLFLFGTHEFNELALKMSGSDNYRLRDLEGAQFSLNRHKHKMGLSIADFALFSQCNVFPIYTHM